MDFEFTIGQEVTAAASGVVSLVVEGSPTAGNYVEIDHLNGLKTRYLHLRSRLQGPPWPSWVYVGAPLSEGLLMAYSGNTGQSTGRHLHFDAKVNGQAHIPEPMSAVSGFGAYGACTGVNSPYWSPPQLVDRDGDGYDDVDENYVSTDVFGRCYPGAETGTFGLKTSDGWPADLEAFTTAPLNTVDRITIQDLTAFLAPTRSRL